MNGEAFGISPRQARVLARIDRLAEAPPQSLVIEGGTASQRLGAALFFAARLNCARPGAPCGVCPACVQIRERVFMDLILLDGLAGTIKVDDVREVRQKAGEPPRGEGYRAVILAEAQSLSIEAANSLLKTLEDPRPGHCFMLLAPQRERLFPTLVSRSFVITLAWPDPEAAAAPGELGDEDPAQWAEALAAFYRTGRGWFARTSAKGRVTRLLADHVLLACARCLAEALSGRGASPLGRYLSELPDPGGVRFFDVLLTECQEALVMQVNPSLVLEWLGVRMFARTSR
ncbi:DNA polymerase III subunit delta' [Desulfolutivibrio sulfoxidireducens]|uniref:DNA polymerase III subunit delta' n=1 Tax=Desulfolutivibrio sulfoxidireducens TaxID=2773299 RepID=UPI00159E48BA|nr:DNA polymerase III subunit delta' [Desulfolutivibrio sulfoxidireducens]QLA21411.1 DNA polymerase III subunit delta' [Desulfolutivibrio sulfoxidireducens]